MKNERGRKRFLNCFELKITDGKYDTSRHYNVGKNYAQSLLLPSHEKQGFLSDNSSLQKVNQV